MKKVLKWTAIVVGVVYSLIVFVAPAVLLHLFCDKHVTYHRVYRAEEAGLPDPDTLWLTTADGFRIHTLEVKPEGEVKGVVICISGIENPSVTAFYGHAREFREIGLTTLMPDLRGHGDSDALITMSAYSSMQDFMGWHFGRFITPVLAYPAKLTTALYAGFKFGVNGFKATPLEAIGNLHGRPALMMQSRDDSQVPFICFEKLTEKAATVSEDLRTYVVDGDEHFITGSFGMPEEDEAYNSVLMKFVKDFIGKSPDGR